MSIESTKPRDETIIEALAEIFGVHEFRVIEWLRIVDLDREERRLVNDHD